MAITGNERLKSMPSLGLCRAPIHGASRLLAASAPQNVAERSEEN